MSKEVKIDYDVENDILWLSSGEKIKESAEVNNFIIDFSYDDKVVGIEILDASEVLSKLVLSEINKSMLSSIKGAGFRVHQGKESSFIILMLSMEVGDKSREISVQIPAPKTVTV